MRIYLGSDHNGFRLKQQLIDFLRRNNYEVEDDGGQKLNPEDDYPVFAARVVTAMQSSDDQEPRGILLCGSGQGMMMAANRYRGIRAALGWDVQQVKAARNDDDANVLAIPAKVFDNQPRLAEQLVMAFLNTPFAGAERFKRRIQEMDRAS